MQDRDTRAVVLMGSSPFSHVRKGTFSFAIATVKTLSSLNRWMFCTVKQICTAKKIDCRDCLEQRYLSERTQRDRD